MRGDKCALIASLLLTITSATSFCQSVSTVVGEKTRRGIASSVRMARVSDVAVDSKGNVFIIDDQRIRKLDLDDTLDIYAGTGKVGYTGNGGKALSATFNTPSGLAIDKSDNLYIADQNNHVVRKIDVASNIISTIAGNGFFGQLGDNLPALSAQLGQPTDLAFDEAGDLFILDGGFGILWKLTMKTGIISRVAGNGSQGFSGDNGAATAAMLYFPNGVAIRNGKAYITDFSNDRVRKVDLSTGIITTIAGPTILTDDEGKITLAMTGVAVDQNDMVYVTTGSRIFSIDQKANVISIIAGNKIAANAGDNGPAKDALIRESTGITIADDNLYFTEFRDGLVRKVDLNNNVITTVAGNGGYDDDAIKAPYISVNDPWDLSIDGHGDVLIADAQNARIRKFHPSDGTITTVAGTGFPGFSGENGLATEAQLSFPNDVAVNAAGDLFISDSQNFRIRKIDHLSGIISTVAGNGIDGESDEGVNAASTSIRAPYKIAFDSDGNLYFSSGYTKVSKVDAITGVITTVAGQNMQGFSGDNGPAANALLNGACGVAVDANNNLYIGDTRNYRIRKVDLATGIIATFAGVGQTNDSGDGGLAINAGVYGFDLTFSHSGDLLISDQTAIRKISMATGVITTVVGKYLNPAGFAGDNGLPANALFNIILGVAEHINGSLYLADNDNNRIRKVCFANVVKPSFVVSDISETHALLTSSSVVGNQWYLNGEILKNETSTTLIAKQSGSYSLTVTSSGCSSVLSDVQQVVLKSQTVTGVEKREIFSMYPNPAVDRVQVVLNGFISNAPVEVNVYDMFGRIVDTQTGYGGELITVNLKLYGQGRFVVIARQGSIVERKILLTHTE